MSYNHRGLHRDSIMVPTQVLIKDPCPFGYPVLLAVAHMAAPGQEKEATVGPPKVPISWSHTSYVATVYLKDA